MSLNGQSNRRPSRGVQAALVVALLALLGAPTPARGSDSDRAPPHQGWFGRRIRPLLRFKEGLASRRPGTSSASISPQSTRNEPTRHELVNPGWQVGLGAGPAVFGLPLSPDLYAAIPPSLAWIPRLGVVGGSAGVDVVLQRNALQRGRAKLAELWRSGSGQPPEGERRDLLAAPVDFWGNTTFNLAGSGVDFSLSRTRGAVGAFNLCPLVRIIVGKDPGTDQVTFAQLVFGLSYLNFSVSGVYLRGDKMHTRVGGGAWLPGSALSLALDGMNLALQNLTGSGGSPELTTLHAEIKSALGPNWFADWFIGANAFRYTDSVFWTRIAEKVVAVAKNGTSHHANGWEFPFQFGHYMAYNRLWQPFVSLLGKIRRGKVGEHGQRDVAEPAPAREPADPSPSLRHDDWEP